MQKLRVIVVLFALFIALQKLASSDDEEVSKDAKGALWELGEHKKNAVEKTAERKQSLGVHTYYTVH